MSAAKTKKLKHINDADILQLATNVTFWSFHLATAESDEDAKGVTDAIRRVREQLLNTHEGRWFLNYESRAFT